ncbi:DUF3021 domain-containing protein [Metabacillus mangrovi]|uniref:DUF3021 domain-containing protein n=1 Tax=Metabacillus mangrovi TaxID=1491830 RepID=UPI00139175E6|nr:DUF3021 domain-containing protein [Metabacillus mangrovi]
MTVELVKRSLIGLGISALITFGALTVLLQLALSAPIQVLWENMLGSMIIGVYFGVSSLIFEVEKWSPLKQLTVHFLLSVSVYFSVAFLTGWVPLSFTATAISASCFIIIYFIIWFSIRNYMKKMESEMNSTLKK